MIAIIKFKTGFIPLLLRSLLFFFIISTALATGQAKNSVNTSPVFAECKLKTVVSAKSTDTVPQIKLM